MKIIKFHSNRLYNMFNESGSPEPSKSVVPKWFASSDKLWKDEFGNEILNHIGEPTLSFKNCPALLDIFTAGYMLRTPCDIEFYKEDGVSKLKIDPNYADFCAPRDPMPDFEVSSEYQQSHFHWYPNWGVGLPSGYSAIYTSPLNRFDLPFTTVSGIIDSDQMDTPGLIPFFLKSDFEGVLKAGTPYMQVLPFKREDWKMDKVYYTYDQIFDRHEQQAQTFRVPGGKAYKNKFWQKKRYDA